MSMLRTSIAVNYGFQQTWTLAPTLTFVIPKISFL